MSTTVGLCHLCGKNPAKTKGRACRPCLNRQAHDYRQRVYDDPELRNRPCARCGGGPRFITPSQISPYCATCHIEVRRVQRIMREYGISAEEYDAKLEAANGRCVVCERAPESRGGRKRLVFDHDHVTGAHRSFICDTCNKLLGLAEDDHKILTRAALYLQGLL